MTTVQPIATARRATGAGRAARWVVGRAAVLVVVAALIIVVAVGGALAASNVMGYQTLIVRSGSMTGTADVGSVVVGRPVAAEDVHVGEIILIRRESDGRALAPVLHRVIERQLDPSGQIVIRTKGDANIAADPERVVLRGRTLTPVFIVSHLGVALAALQTPIGWFGLVIFPLLVALAVALCRLWACETEHNEQR